MEKIISLTVQESKRLIAKAVANLDSIKQKLQKGMITICKGTTNSYIVEEILKKPINKIDYTTGLSLPTLSEIPQRQELPDLVLIDGKPQNLSSIESVKKMTHGDIFIKGGNALNYSKKQVGILIAHPQSGTIGGTIGTIIAQKINLLIPIGLEKLVFEDIFEISFQLSKSIKTLSMMPVTGTIFTEIEAIKSFAKIDSKLISAGGIFGAEGSIKLLLSGETEEIEKILKLLETIFGEPSF